MIQLLGSDIIITGDSMKVASRFQMQKIDNSLLKHYTIEELVDKASACLYEEVKHFKKVCIVCGGGNNGADGYALALKLHPNTQVKVFACKEDHLSQACNYYYQMCNDLLIDFESLEEELKNCDCIIDAIFGFGCHSNPLGIYEKVIQLINQSNKTIISVDVPSGLNCDTGEVYDNCVCANKTISFFALKLGFFYPSAKKVLGEIIIKNLDVIETKEIKELPNTIHSITINKRKYDGHKGIYGKSFLICGSESYKGAALLSSKACVYTGCGITCLYSIDSVLQGASVFVPEAIHASSLENIHQYQSILIGCGLKDNEELLKKVLFETHQPLVIDASSLNDLANHLDWLENQNRSIILTPHIGEFKRLCPTCDDLSTSAIAFAKKHRVILVLKGQNTLITDGTHSYRNTTGNGAMAIGGCGDVLAGMIVSFLAQGYDPMTCCKNAVYLHGFAGDILAKENHSVIPSKIIELIPKVMKEYED